MSRDRDLPPIRTLPKTIEAPRFNRIRLSLLRVANPLRVSLRGRVCHGDMLLSDEKWLCVDRQAGDMPLIAWTDFNMRERSALNEPVLCTLHLYHTHAGLLIGPVLSALDAVLVDLLAASDRCAGTGTLV